MQVTFLASYLFLDRSYSRSSLLEEQRRREEGEERERTAGNGNGVYDQKCRTGLIDDGKARNQVDRRS
jgi:hypothetical protein